MALEAIRADVDSIDESFMAVFVLQQDPEATEPVVAWLQRQPEATDQQWQYVVSALTAALNDPTGYASSIRAKARREVREYTP